MNKLLLLLCFSLLISGCSGVATDSQQIETERSPAISATPGIINSVETAPSIDATNTIEPRINPPDQPRIILFIGDGMGSEHRLAGQYYSVGEVRELAMDAMPVSGWLQTDSFGNQLTESAASATALATGQKTYNGVISLDIHGNQLKTILEYAQELGMSTGLISTKFITDATTAAFGAHVKSNSMRAEIASQFIDHRLDVMLGGGESDFLPKEIEGCHPGMGNRTDNRNLIQEALDAGYTVICDEQTFEKLDPKTNTLVFGLFADENMTRPFSPSLAEMTRTAIEILSQNPNGFFLVVEAATIDTASHFHQTQNVLEDIVGLDKAVEAGMEYAEMDENILVIVTADHETGGMKVNLYPNGNNNKESLFYMPNGTEFYIRWFTGDHTTNDVPISASGLGSEKLTGINDNTFVFDVMLEYLGVSANHE